jgi:hypothetical protein
MKTAYAARKASRAPASSFRAAAAPPPPAPSATLVGRREGWRVVVIHVAQPRLRAYLELLGWGLLAIRDDARGGRIALCKIEADHLHNIPTLLEEPNERRHLFYILQERGRYLERLKELGASEYLERRVNRYSESWLVLASIAGVELPA